MDTRSEICILAERHSADECLSWGLVDKVVPHGQALASAMALAELVVLSNRTVVQRTKRAIDAYGGLHESLEIKQRRSRVDRPPLRILARHQPRARGPASPVSIRLTPQMQGLSPATRRHYLSIRRVRVAARREVTVVVVSSNEDSRVISEALEAGAAAYLPNGLTLAGLARALAGVRPAASPT